MGKDKQVVNSHSIPEQHVVLLHPLSLSHCTHTLTLHPHPHTVHSGVCNAGGTCIERCEANNMTACRCEGDDECLQCCEIGGVCSPLELLPNATIVLSDGASCSVGVCIDVRMHST